MAKKAARTPSINRALLRRSPTWSITAVARTIRRARGWDVNKTLPSGQKLVACFRPFLEYLVTCADLSPKIIQKHAVMRCAAMRIAHSMALFIVTLFRMTCI